MENIKRLKDKIRYAEKNLFEEDFHFSMKNAIEETKRVEEQRKKIRYFSRASNKSPLHSDVYMIYSLNN